VELLIDVNWTLVAFLIYLINNVNCFGPDKRPFLVHVMSVVGLEAKSVHKAASIQFIVCKARGLVDTKWEFL